MSYSQSAQTWITQFYLQITPCLHVSFVSSPDGTTANPLYLHINIFASHARAVEKYCDECVCLCVCLSVRQDISGTPRAIFTKLLCMLPMSVARSSTGMLMIGRIANRQEGHDGSAQRGRSVIYDCLVLTDIIGYDGISDTSASKRYDATHGRSVQHRKCYYYLPLSCTKEIIRGIPVSHCPNVKKYTRRPRASFVNY